MRFLLFSCLIPALVSTSLAAAPQYQARQDIATGFTSLDGLAVADFNGDGKPDIAVTDNGDKRVVVYLNDGKGSFLAPISTSVTMNALSAGSIVAGDFNEDGKQDLILGTVAGQQADIYLAGNGDGTFTQKQDLPGSSGFETATATDINGDSHLDLLLGGNGGLAVYLGDGRGNFQSQDFSNQGTGSLFTGIAAGDFNNDGKQDFSVASPIGSPGLRIYLGNGDGTFSSPTILTNTTISSPRSVSIADFNGDNKLDLLVSSGFHAYIIPGNGDGTFDLSNAANLPSPSFNIPSGSTPVAPLVAAADIDGDTKIDAIVANPYSTSLALLLNDGTGKFPQSLADFNSPIDLGTSQLRTADLNGDGLPDIILANNTTQNVSVFYSIPPKADFQISTPTPAQTIAAGATASYSVVVTPVGGLTGSVTLTCSQLPALASCDSVTVPINGQPVTATVTVHTTAQHSAIKTAGVGFAALFLLTLLPLRRRISFRLTAAVAIFALIGFGSGCSGGGSSSKSGGTVTGTPSGSTSFTITGTVTQGGQTVSHSTTATIVVQ